MYNRLGKAANQVSGNVDTLSGQLGYMVGGVFRVVDPDNAKKFFVRYANGNWVSAYHYGRVPQKPGLPVLTSIDNLGRPYIVGEDKTKSDKFHPSSSGGSGVGWHIHPRGSGMEFIEDSWLLKQLRVAPVADSLAVTVAAGSYIFAKALVWFTGVTVDLSSYVPTTVEGILWLVIAINPLTNTIVVVPGEVVIVDVPDLASIAEIICYQLGYIPLSAVWLKQGDTSIPSFRVENLVYRTGGAAWYLEDLFNVRGYPYENYVLTHEDGYAIWKPTSNTSDTHAVHLNVSDEFGTISQDVSPVIGDRILLEDATTKEKKWAQIGDLPAESGSIPLTTAGDLLTVDDLATENINQTGNQDYGQVSETVIPDTDITMPSIGGGNVTIFYNFWVSASHPGGASTFFTIRIRRTDISGSIIYSTGSFTPNNAVDSTGGHIYQITGSYIDTAPTDGKYIATQQYDSGPSTHLYGDTRILTATPAVPAINRRAIGANGTVLTAVGGIIQWDWSRAVYSTADVSNPPTASELTSAFGDPTVLGAGFMGVVNDNNLGINEYFCITDGLGNWIYFIAVKAL